MPGKVLLAPDSSYFSKDEISTDKTILFTEEMLSWQIFSQFVGNKNLSGFVSGFVVLNEDGLRCFRAIFRALMELDGFTYLVLFGVDAENRRLKENYEAFLEIRFQDKIVKTFLFRLPNVPFRRMFEWAGDDSAWNWTPEKWKEFFLQQIINKMEEEVQKANFAQSVLRHLGKLPEEKNDKKPAHEVILKKLLDAQHQVWQFNQSFPFGGHGPYYDQAKALIEVLASMKIPDSEKPKIIEQLTSMKYFMDLFGNEIVEIIKELSS